MKPRRARRITGVMNNTRGFTLLELMVTLLVSSILLAIAVPAFRSVVQQNRLAAAVNSLVGAFAIARSEAVKRGVNVTVCPSGGGTNCNNAAPWQNGWLVFTDGGTIGTVDGTDLILRVGQPVTGGVTFTSNGFTNSYVTYTAAGFINGGGGNLTVCAPKATFGGSSGTTITLDPSGQVSSNAYKCP